MDDVPSRSRLPHVLLAVYVAICVSALVWPIYAWAGGRIEPLVFGLPFALAWNVIWVVITFVVLCIYHRAVEGTSA